jgi:formylglycine-generating enzyme required for sulfatase activity
VPVADRRTGVVIAFSTAQGETATDEGAKSAPYAAALAEEIVKPGRNDLQVFHEVRTRVVRTTGGQTPWTHDGLVGDRVVFKPALSGAVQALPPAPARHSEAADAWSVAKDTKSIATLEAFIRRFGDTFYGDLAKERLAELKQPATVKPAPAPVTHQQAEAQRDAEAQRVWHATKDTSSVPVLEAFAVRYANTFYADQARRQIEELKKHQTAIALPDKTTAPLRAAKSLTPAKERALKPKDTFKECGECPEMVVVPAGHFMMGHGKDDLPPQRVTRDQVPVTIARPFAIGRFAVTRGEFAGFVRATRHNTDGGCKAFIGTGSDEKLFPDRNWRSPGFSQDDRHPVVCVNWNDASAYVTWLSSSTGKAYRLPSEAEREYVSRAGTVTPFWWGSSISPQQANYDGNFAYAGGAKGEYRRKTVRSMPSFQIRGGSSTSTAMCGSGPMLAPSFPGSTSVLGWCAVDPGTAIRGS